MYASRAAGSHYSHQGGAANYICLPNNPSYLQYTSGHQLDRDYIYGSEYETSKNGPSHLFTMFHAWCAMSQEGKQCSLYLHGPPAPPPGDLDSRVQWLLDV